jgi:hypothetical protein
VYVQMLRCGNIVHLTIRFLDVAKFIAVISFPDGWFENIFSPYFCIAVSYQISCGTFGIDHTHILVRHRFSPSYQFLSLIGTFTFRKISH